MEKAAVTTSWDDGHPLDLKLAELLKKYEVPATFYLPLENWERECMTPAQVREIAGAFDVGGHTCRHLDLRRIPREDARREIGECKKRLEDIVGREVLSFCYPSGSFDNGTAGMVREAGFIGARGTRSLTRRIGDRYRMGATVHVKDWWPGPYLLHSMAARDLEFFGFMLGRNLFFKGWHRVAIEALDFIVRNGGVWHLWGHSWEIEDSGDWGRLEDVLRRIGGLAVEAARLDNSQLLTEMQRQEMARSLGQ